MKWLSLDSGKKHTGVAFADSGTGIPLPQDTIHHSTEQELIDAVAILASERDVDGFVIGLPLLPGGEEGEQVRFVREVAKKLCLASPWCELHFIDERETSRVFHPLKSEDAHAEAAVKLLQVFLDRR